LIDQGAVEPAQQLLALWQPGQPGLADGLARRGGGKRPAGGRQRAGPAAGGEQDVEHDGGGAAGTEGADAQAGADQVGGVLLDGGTGDGILHGAQASVRGWFSWPKPFSSRSLRPSSPPTVSPSLVCFY